MTPKIRNIIIFIAIAAVFVSIYIFFIKPSSAPAGLVSSVPITAPAPVANTSGTAGTPSGTPATAQDFLSLLLSVNSIKIDDSIFSDPAFQSLHDSSITLTPDGTQGRPNPFAQFGSDAVAPAITTPTTPASVPANPTSAKP